jgi:hypothetical protein
MINAQQKKEKEKKMELVFIYKHITMFSTFGASRQFPIIVRQLQQLHYEMQINEPFSHTTPKNSQSSWNSCRTMIGRKKLTVFCTNQPKKWWQTKQVISVKFLIILANLTTVQ